MGEIEISSVLSYLILILIIDQFYCLSFSIDTLKPITFPTPIIQILQLSNSSILIQYSNRSFVVYDNQFQFQSSNYLDTSKPQTNKFSLTPSEIYLSSTSLDKSTLYVFDLKNAILKQAQIIPNAILFTWRLLSGYKISVIMTNIYFCVGYSAYQANIMYLPYFNISIANIRNSSNQFLDGILIKANMDYRIYCFTNYRQIFQLNATFTNNSVFVETHRSIYNHTSIINRIFYCNCFVFFIDINSQIGGYDLILNRSVYFSFYSPNIQNIIYLDSYYYFLINQRLIKTSYSPQNQTFSLVQLVQQNVPMLLSTNKMNLIQNQGLNMLSFAYETGSNSIYSFSRCLGNAKYNNLTGNCENYICEIKDCVVCNFKNDICTKCNISITPFVVNCFNRCLYPICNVLNCLYCYNTVNCSICNSDFYLNQFGECTVNPPQSYNQLLIKYNNLLNATLMSPFYLSMNKISGSRKYIKQLFALFSNFDDLQLYNYHNLAYDRQISNFFQVIQHIQREKWNGISLIYFQTQYMGVDFNSIQAILDFKYQWTQPKFLQVKRNSNGYVLNTLSYYCSNFLIIIFIFIGFRLLRCIFQNYLHQYSFWIYLIIIFLEGNLQFMSYLIAFQYQTLFFLCYMQKIYSACMIILGFSLVFIGITIYSIIRYLIKDKSKYLFQNCKIHKQGVFYLTAQLGIRNISLGFIHFLIEYQKKIKIIYLLLIEILFLMLNILAIRKFNKLKIIKKKIKHWITILNSFIRIVLVFMFLVHKEQQQQIYKSKSFNFASNLSLIQLFMLLSFLYLMICSVTYQVSISTINFINNKVKCEKQNHYSNEQQNNKEQQNHQSKVQQNRKNNKQSNNNRQSNTNKQSNKNKQKSIITTQNTKQIEKLKQTTKQQKINKSIEIKPIKIKHVKSIKTYSLNKRQPKQKYMNQYESYTHKNQQKQFKIETEQQNKINQNSQLSTNAHKLKRMFKKVNKLQNHYMPKLPKY